MVSMVRGLIADPEIVNKSREDRTEQIRPCIGALVMRRQHACRTRSRVR